MKPRHPNLEWIRKVLADLERDRGDPRIAALIDRQLGDHQIGELIARSEPARRVNAHELLESAPPLFKL
jgi:hypothetical protein